VTDQFVSCLKFAKRTIPLAPRVVHLLTELKNNRRVASIDGYVFTKPNGEPIDKHLDRIWARALRKAGMRHRPSYQLRHTFATHCMIKGLPLPYIAKVLGHSTIDPLVRHYASWINDATKEQDDKLKDLFRATALGSEKGTESREFSRGFQQIHNRKRKQVQENTIEWGRRGDLNPRIPGPQPGALTTWRRLP
jgi:hypothetical protein